MSLGSSTEVAADGFRVHSSFAFEFCKSGVSGVTSNFCQRRMLKEGFSVVCNGKNCLC